MSETLGSVVAARRQQMDLTQRELARKVGISNSTVSRIESDDGITPDTKTIKALAEVLGVDYYYLLALSGQIEDQPEIRVIQRAARNMDKEQKENMMTVLKAAFSVAFDNAGEDVPGMNDSPIPGGK